LFEMDGVDLSFDEEALRAVARMAISRKTGARGLRAILEDVMLDIMFEIPSKENLAGCRITRQVIEKESAPLLVEGKPDAKKAAKKEKEPKRSA